MFLSFSTLIVSPPSSATLWITPQSYFTWLRCGIQLKSPLQSCVRGKDAFPLCQMLMTDRILFLKSLNAVGAASLSRNLKLIVAKKHPFRQEGVVKLACQIIIFFVWHLRAGKSEIYVNNRLACNTVAAPLNSSTAVFVKAVQTAQTEWVEDVQYLTEVSTPLTVL